MLFFTFKPEYTDDDIKKCFDEYRALTAITTLENVDAAENTSTEGYDKGYTHAAIASFKDKEAVAEFLVDKNHRDFADNTLNPMIDKFVLLEIQV